MSQKITIRVGTGAGVNPEAVARAILAATKYLRELDLATTNLGHQRLRWQIVHATKTSPMCMDMEGDVAIREVNEPPIMKYHRELCDSLDNVGRTPPAFATERVLEPLREFLGIGLNGAEHTSINEFGGAPLVSSQEADARLDVLIKTAHREPYSVHTSVSGQLRQVTNDDRPRKERFAFQLIDQLTGEIVECAADQETVMAMDGHTTGRVVVYGIVDFTPDNIPRRVQVEDYRLIDENTIPSIDDIHALGVDITGGVDANDFVRGMRNAEDDD